MNLTPREQDKLLLFTAALVAERRKELMDYGRTILSRDDVMEGIPEMVTEVQVEATFPDGTKLVTVHNPII